MLTVDARSPVEPRMLLPQLQGWERTAEPDSFSVRLVIHNTNLTANGFTPNAVVVLESLTGVVNTAQQGLEAERTSVIRGGGTNLADSRGTVCGYPSNTLSYTAPTQGGLPPRPAVMVIVVATYDNRMYAAMVTVQTLDPDNPTYVQDSETILKGFRVLPPTT